MLPEKKPYLNETFDSYYIEPPELSAVQFVDSLPNARSFEHFLYDNRAQRATTHAMTEHPVVFNEETVHTILPEEFSDHIGMTGPIEISNLRVSHIEDPSFCDTSINFTIGGDSFSLETNNEEGAPVKFTRPNTYGDMVSYPMSPQAPLKLLAAFLYMREYNRSKLDQKFDLDESAILAERIGDSDLIERIIMTLGHFDGVSSTSTQAFLPLNEQILVINLTSTESPQLTHSSNDISLTLLEKTDASSYDSIELSQLNADIKKFRGKDFNDQHSVVAENDTVREVAPEDTEDWLRLCTQFQAAMQPALANYQHLDDSKIATVSLPTEEQL